jgi:hypothetical protein
MKQSSQVLKQGPSQDQVSDLVDDINESVQIQQEVAEELSRPIGPVFDEDELLGELEELEMKETVKKEVILPIRKVSVLTEKDMPNVPISMANKSLNSSEDELKELESLMC